MKKVNNYLKSSESCISRHDTAAHACLENLSPYILDGVTTLNTLMSGLSMSGVQDNCSGFADAMDLAKKAMTGYTGACGAAKAMCGTSCSSARKSLEAISKANMAPCEPLNKQDPQGQEMCNQFTQALSKLQEDAAKDTSASDQKSVEAKKKNSVQKNTHSLQPQVSQGLHH